MNSKTATLLMTCAICVGCRVISDAGTLFELSFEISPPCEADTFTLTHKNAQSGKPIPLFVDHTVLRPVEVFHMWHTNEAAPIYQVLVSQAGQEIGSLELGVPSSTHVQLALVEDGGDCRLVLL